MKRIISENFSLHASRIPSLTDGMKVYDEPGIIYVDSGLACDTFNIIHITDSRLVTETTLSSILKHYRDKNFPYCIWIDEDNMDERMKAIFSSLGLTEQNMEPGMALDLVNYIPQDNTSPFNIRFVETPEHLKNYALVIAKNWNPPDQHVIAYYDKTATHILGKQENTFLAICIDNGETAGVIEMFPSDNKTIGLYGLATLQKHRGKGIASALMDFALRKAKEMGYSVAILQASEDGIGIYERMGFKVQAKYYEFS